MPSKDAIVGSTCFAMKSNIFAFDFASFLKPAGLGSSLGSSGFGMWKLPSTAPTPWQVLQFMSPYLEVLMALKRSCIFGRTPAFIHASLCSCVHFSQSPGPGWLGGALSAGGAPASGVPFDAALAGGAGGAASVGAEADAAGVTGGVVSSPPPPHAPTMEMREKEARTQARAR